MLATTEGLIKYDLVASENLPPSSVSEQLGALNARQAQHYPTTPTLSSDYHLIKEPKQTATFQPICNGCFKTL